MIARNNVQIIVEVKSMIKKFVPKFGPEVSKLAQNLGFLPFSQVWFVSVP